VNTEQGQKILYEIISKKEGTNIPKIGSIVVCKVIKTTKQYVKVKILLVDDKVLKNETMGMIRKEDIRLTEVDKVEIQNSYRPNDILKAAVMSLGDNRSYFLTTAKNEFGVIYAESISGYEMVPVSWKEMECSVTNNREYRKVAKVNFDN
jgi:exosome complex component CSL4